MASKRFKVDILSLSSVKQLMADLKAYQDELPRKAQLLVERLTELGVESAKANIVTLNAVFTGELHNSIHSEQIAVSGDSIIFVVVADSSHAIYVEMGTGVVGAESPYPGKLPAIYAQGKTIRQLSDGRYGWFYKRDGRWYFTEGMPSRPFMYKASMDIMQAIEKTAKEIFA